MSTFCCAVDEYTLEFEGIDNPKILNLLYSASQLKILQNSPPTTNIGLRRRAENDIKNIVKILHSQAYYNSRVKLDFDFEHSPVIVKIFIETGPIYPFESFNLVPDPQSSGSFPLKTVDLKDIGICIGEPATTLAIIEAESSLEQLMNNAGYPYGQVTSREVIANQETKTISTSLFVNSGLPMYFGTTEIVGNLRVKNRYFRKHITWSEGDLYSPQSIQCTQNKLELSGLFSSVSISIPDEAPQDGDLPVSIEVKEAKPRSIGFGVNYETERGPGASASWVHRNLKGMGDRLAVNGTLWSDKQFGGVSYIQPDWRRLGQDLIWSADYLRERDEGYTSKSYSLSSILSVEVSRSLRMTYGVMYKHLIDTDIHESKRHESQKDEDETFNLFKLPISLYWNNTNDVLNPTTGQKIKLKSIPSYKFIGSQIFYSINILSGSYYIPLDRRKNHVFALQGTFGFIPGPCKTEIPRSELFDAGTDTLLRGYKYKTVSPLDDTYKPTGGRSMMIYSLEYRYRMSNDIGWVLFYDFGNVYANRVPQFNKKILQSVGIGFRYFTPVGPIRLDIAVPLNPRKHVESSSYQAYLSIGQSF